MIPLADRIRPKNIQEVVGQKHLLGEGKILSNLITNKKVVNMIFFGPPGVGKTTVANILSQVTDKKLYRLNATTASIKDIHQIIKELESLIGYKGVILYLDEIQNFNKKQQQSLLEYMEDGRITLIASTAENPYHYVYGPLLSRSMIFEFQPLSEEEIISSLKRGIILLEKELNSRLDISEDALGYLALMSGGDLRRALNSLELVTYSSSSADGSGVTLDLSDIEEIIQNKGFSFDNKGDVYYDALSALQKSIRGSDPDAAIFYTAVLLKGGQLIPVCRRLLVIVSEDIGLAYPQSASIVYALTQSALQVGLPEARIPIAQAVILLAASPKSNASYMAVNKALQDIATRDVGTIPMHLRDTHYAGADKLNRKGYKYPHDYEGSYVQQQYLPDELLGTQYYHPGDNKMEQMLKQYLASLKDKDNLK